MAELLANEPVAILVVQSSGEVVHLCWILITNLHRYFSSCKFLTEDCGLFQGVDGSVRIDTALETEACIG